MLRWPGRYHRHLVAKGASSKPHLRLLGVQDVAFPWFMAMMGLLAVCVILRPSDTVREWLVIVTGPPIIIGMVYAMVTYGISGAVADRKRGKDA
ncbi:MAG: hypothetical protein EBR82_25905 [Caulobacteraceae bacterium]|nr:hypothetical protein [Caulobacteraceae bacterium]